MYCGKMGLQDCISPATETTENVLVSKSNTGGFALAYEGGFLSSIGDNLFICKRTLANKLNLQIVASFPSRMY